METKVIIRNNNDADADADADAYGSGSGIGIGSGIGSGGGGDNGNSIQSMASIEKIVINPITKRKEVTVKTTITHFNGSSEIRTEQRQL